MHHENNSGVMFWAHQQNAGDAAEQLHPELEQALQRAADEAAARQELEEALQQVRPGLDEGSRGGREWGLQQGGWQSCPTGVQHAACMRLAGFAAQLQCCRYQWHDGAVCCVPSQERLRVDAALKELQSATEEQQHLEASLAEANEALDALAAELQERQAAQQEAQQQASSLRVHTAARCSPIARLSAS